MLCLRLIAVAATAAVLASAAGAGQAPGQTRHRLRPTQCPEGNPDALFRADLVRRRSTAVAPTLWGDYIQDVSPDGRWVVYGQAQLRVARTDGRFRRTITTMSGRWSRWSPDGRRIAFVSRASGDYAVWVVNSDGSDLHKVADRGMGIAWSPDSRMLSFIKPDGTGGVYYPYRGRLIVAAADGSHLLDVAPSGYTPELLPVQPSWSPRGYWIAYPGHPYQRLELIGRDGSRHRALRAHVGADATWSPSGREVVFDYFNDRGAAFGIVDLRGRRSTSLEKAGAAFPTWSPRGGWIAYVATDPRDPEAAWGMQVYAIRPDGSGPRQISSDPPTANVVVSDEIKRILWVSRGPWAGRQVYYFRNYCTDPNE